MNLSQIYGLKCRRLLARSLLVVVAANACTRTTTGRIYTGKRKGDNTEVDLDVYTYVGIPTRIPTLRELLRVSNRLRSVRC